MVTVEGFSRLVAGIYTAAVTPQHWRMAIRDIHCALGGSNGGLFSGRVSTSQYNTIPVEAVRSYADYYHRLDRVLNAVEHAPIGAVQTGTRLFPLVRKTEFYSDWLRPLDIDDGLFVRLTDGTTPTCLVVAAPGRTEPFDTRERVKLLSDLVPHFQQALRTQDKLSAVADSAGELAGALEVVRHGVVIVAGDHMVTNLNSAAELILRAEDGVCVRSGRIAATGMHAERELHRALQDVLVSEDSTVRGRSLTCYRPSGKRPYVIHVVPSYRRDADGLPELPKALVLIVDPENLPEPAAAVLRRLYYLTEAEAEVALRVMNGSDLKEVSEQLSISLATVRTHLQRVFDKTDTHRQAELVRLLFALCP